MYETRIHVYTDDSNVNYAERGETWRGWTKESKERPAYAVFHLSAPVDAIDPGWSTPDSGMLVFRSKRDYE